jgi:hypothetical protein
VRLGILAECRPTDFRSTEARIHKGQGRAEGGWRSSRGAPLGRGHVLGGRARQRSAEAHAFGLSETWRCDRKVQQLQNSAAAAQYMLGLCPPTRGEFKPAGAINSKAQPINTYNMVAINNKKQVYQTSLLIQNNQEALILATINESNLRIGITFHEMPNGTQPSSIWKYEDDTLRFTFSGWSNPLGTCTPEPTKFGDVNGQKIYFQMAHHSVGGLNLAHIFIFLGESNE